jgi:hypothetical protein
MILAAINPSSQMRNRDMIKERILIVRIEILPIKTIFSIGLTIDPVIPINSHKIYTVIQSGKITKSPVIKYFLQL